MPFRLAYCTTRGRLVNFIVLNIFSVATMAGMAFSKNMEWKTMAIGGGSIFIVSVPGLYNLIMGMAMIVRWHWKRIMERI